MTHQAEPKPRTIRAIVEEAILARLPDSYVLDRVLAERPEAQTTRRTVQWYRSELKSRLGSLPSPLAPTAYRLILVAGDYSVTAEDGLSADDDFLALNEEEAIRRARRVAEREGSAVKVYEMVSTPENPSNWCFVAYARPSDRDETIEV